MANLFALVWVVLLCVFLSSEIVVDFFISLVGLLVSVAWLTLLERKLLAGMQLRKGPNHVSCKGAIQPIYDFLKLVQRKTSPVFSSSWVLYNIAPLLSCLVSLSMLVLLPSVSTLGWGGLLFFILASLHLFPLLASS